MSIEFDDGELATRLRQVLKSRGVSQRSISKSLNVPYRTVQNYLSGEIKIPATFFLRLCHYVGIEADYFIYGDFSLVREDMHDAMIRALDASALLPPRPPGGAPQTDAEQHDWQRRVETIVQTKAAFAEAYERYRREWLGKRGGGLALPFGQRRATKRS